MKAIGNVASETAEIYLIKDDSDARCTRRYRAQRTHREICHWIIVTCLGIIFDRIRPHEKTRKLYHEKLILGKHVQRSKWSMQMHEGVNRQAAGSEVYLRHKDLRWPGSYRWRVHCLR